LNFPSAKNSFCSNLPDSGWWADSAHLLPLFKRRTFVKN
jgi:hypothetical protein